MGRSRYKITEPQQSHFVTLSVLHWIPVFNGKVLMHSHAGAWEQEMLICENLRNLRIKTPYFQCVLRFEDRR